MGRREVGSGIQWAILYVWMNSVSPLKCHKIRQLITWSHTTVTNLRPVWIMLWQWKVDSQFQQLVLTISAENLVPWSQKSMNSSWKPVTQQYGDFFFNPEAKEEKKFWEGKINANVLSEKKAPVSCHHRHQECEVCSQRGSVLKTWSLVRSFVMTLWYTNFPACNYTSLLRSTQACPNRTSQLVSPCRHSSQWQWQSWQWQQGQRQHTDKHTKVQKLLQAE